MGREIPVAGHLVRFDTHPDPIAVPPGTLIGDAARQAGIEIRQPCGGQGRCGRCAVQVESGRVRRRSILRLSKADLDAGYALACQTVIEGDVSVRVPPPELIERRLTTEQTAPEVEVPAGYNAAHVQTIQCATVQMSPPTMDDQTDDWERLLTALRVETGVDRLNTSLEQLRTLGATLREADWKVSVTFDTTCEPPCLIGIEPANDATLWGLAIDIGTTTVSVWLVDLSSGEVKAQATDYNRQIARGEDVISRIIYASKNDGGEELRTLVLESINTLTKAACAQAEVAPEAVVKATLSGNSTMMHLLLGLPPQSIRLEPFVTAINHPPLLCAREVGLEIHPYGRVDVLPGVASYVGADITAGVLSNGMRSSESVRLFIDVGTNGEIVLGSSDWLVTCACSAGPAFEGAGVLHGIRADRGAIEEVWIDGDTYEPTFQVIGRTKPRGFCGSGLISLLAEMFLTGVVDKSGHFDLSLETPRVRKGENGPEYVVCWADASETGEDLAITRTDIDNLLRAKAAIYAGFTILADRVGMDLKDAEQVLIGGAFGKYINVEKAIEIGLLPDMDWDRFQFLGNTSVRGAYLALLDREARAAVAQIASAMTYIELSADNTFYDAFTSALFLPHTDLSRFPSVTAAMAT